MEPALWELNEGNANEEVGVIIRLHQPDTLPPNVRLITQFGEIATVRLLRGAIVDIRQDEAVASMKAPDFLTPGDEVLIDTEDFHAPSSASDNRRPLDHDDITGKGVVVGVVDWGCDFTHPNFRYADGTTRLLALWDQSAPYDVARPNRYGYGVIHTAQAINEALASDDPPATLGYFFSRSDLSGSGTHGTHVLDIAAGNGHAGGSVGVAPEANLVFVHLHNLAFPSQVNLGDSVAVLEAADFILDIAQDRPVVMNFSMGRQMGPHDGSTLVEQGFDAIVTTQPGRAIVQSAGNYFDRSAHSSGQILPGQVITIPFVVSPADVTPNELEIWYSGRDVFTIAVRSPNGILSKQTGLNDQSTIQVSGQTVCKVYHRAREPNNLDNNCHVYMDNGAPPGRWELILTGVDVVDGRFNIWIERDATCPHCQSRFEHNYTVPLSTTGTICNGLRTIAVGAYNAHDPMRSLGRFSSSGPTRDGRRKPNLIAPGVQILAARSGPHHPDRSADFLARKSGTSMAAPHVVGAVALMFDLANQLGYKLAINDTLNLLLGSTTAVEAEGDEIYRIGSGMLDTDAALEATRDFLDKQFLDKPLGISVSSKTFDLSDTREVTVMSSDLPETVTSETPSASDWLKFIESEIKSQIPVQTHFNRILQSSGLQTINSLRDLFMMFARPGLTSFRPQFAYIFDVIAVPGGIPVRGLRPGDVLIRYIPGEEYIHIAFINSENLLLPAQATTQGWTLETMRPGYYGVVVEAGAFPHHANQRYARRILDAHGIVPSNQLILRTRHSPQFHQHENETMDEQIQLGVTVSPLRSEQVLRLRERTRERFNIPGMGVESGHPNYDGWPPYGRFRQRAALTRNNVTIPEQMFNALRSRDALNSLERTLRLFEGEGRISRSSINIPLVLVIAAREGGPRRVFSNSSARVISAGRDTHPDGVSGLDYLYNAIDLFPSSIRREVQLVRSGYVSGRENRRAASLPERYLLAGIIVWIKHVEGLVLTHIKRSLGQERGNSLISSMSTDALRAWISLGFAGIGYVGRSLDRLNSQSSSSGNLLNLILTDSEIRWDFHVQGAIVSSARAWMLEQMLGNSTSRETVDEQIQIEDIESNDEHAQPEDIDELWGLDDDAESILIEDIYENNPPPMTPTRSPMAVPSSNPAPFAPVPPAGSYWPIITNHRQGRTISYTADDGSIVGQSARRWLADRSSGTRYHIGIDLFANYGDPVVAIEDGEIVDFRPFCCGDNKTTNSLLVAHANVVVNYGEVAPDSLRRNGLSIGARVRAGQIIANVGRNPGGSSMIHFETYTPGTRRTNRWMKNQSRPANVLNPTQYLLHLQEHGLVGIGDSSGSSVPTTPTTPSTPPGTGDRRSPAYIRWVQSSLNQVMNAGLTVDGISGSRTRASVRTFQRSRGLAADGIVGAQTEAALIAAGATPPPLSASEELMADLAESGSGRRSPEYIRWVQSSLNQIDNAGLVVDGISGPRTREAVRNFQRTRGLMVDGIVGPQTEAALIASGAPLPPTVGGASIPIPPIPPISPIPPAPTPVPITPPTNWVSRSSDERMRYVMDLLVREYLYSINGAAGIVGNLWAESGVLPNRVEGSSRSAPMTAPDFNGRRVEFTADQVMNRNRATRQGPRLPGVGLAQWTTSSRRAGLFLHTFQGQRPGADILYNMDAQVNYLVTELQSRYRQVDSFLRRATVSLEDASDEVLYNYEVPGSILSEPDAVGRRRKLPRHDAAVIRIFEQRRGYARNALRAYTSSAHSGSETDEVLEILDGESVLHQCLPGEGPPAAVPDPEGRGLHPLIYRGTGQLRSRNPTVGDAQQLLNRFLEQIRSSLDSCDVRTAEVQRVISQGRAALQRSGQDPLIVVDCRFGPSTETATKMFQACKGLVQDGKIGPRTWEKLALLRAPVPPVPPVPPVLTLNPTRWAPILRRKMSTATNLRTGNAVKFLIDGLRTFQEMVDAISMAQSPEHYIYLLGWILKDNFPLIPGVSSSSFRNLLSAAASRGVQVRAMLWDQVGTQNSNEVDRINRLSTGGAILDNETPRPISGFGSHHQKVLIVKGNRGLITFCGGIDVNDDRIPASSSSGGSGSSGGGTPLHDVHCRIIGPSAHDLLQTFIRRWDHHPDSRTIDSRRGALLGRSEPLSSPITTSLVGNSSTGNSSTVCIARTFNPVTRSGTLRRERDVRELLIEAIRNAQRFIYMEDQYLIHLVAATELRAAVPRLQHLTILIAASELSDLPCVWKFRRDFINALTTGLNANDRAKVRIFFLVTPPPSRPPRFGTHTYVHAKTWIFDDELAVIGSANCNRRGWEHDSEVNAFIFDDRNPETGTPTFAQELRKQLWAEHLNVSTSAVDDGVTSAGLWLTPPAGARVMPYDPTAGSDLTPDAVCDRTVGIIDPTP